MFGIFSKLGGEKPVLDVIQRRRGFRPKHRAVAEWIWLRQIPAINIHHLTEECRERGIPVSSEDFRLPKVLPHRTGAKRATGRRAPTRQTNSRSGKGAASGSKRGVSQN